MAKRTLWLNYVDLLPCNRILSVYVEHVMPLRAWEYVHSSSKCVNADWNFKLWCSCYWLLFIVQLTIIRMFQQFANFQVYQARLSALIGAEPAQQLVNEALVMITLGGNDFVNNYFLTPITPRRRQFSIEAFSDYLISEYRNILRVNYLNNLLNPLFILFKDLTITPWPNFLAKS